MYICYLNDRFYGSGSGDHMNKLFKDYVTTCDMYGKYECKFRIVRVTDKADYEQLESENELMKQTLERYAQTSYGSLAQDALNKLEESE